MCTLLGDPFPSIREVGVHVRAGGILVKLSLMNFNGPGLFIHARWRVAERTIHFCRISVATQKKH